MSKTDNVMHLAHLVKQTSVDLASDLFCYYRLGMSQFVIGAYFRLNNLGKLMLHITECTDVNRDVKCEHTLTVRLTCFDKLRHRESSQWMHSGIYLISRDQIRV